jgi:glycosyltransferase involved in cell wall biosynthesis
MNVSIIIATRNRANALLRTLHALTRLSIPQGLNYEILVVDNGSSDSTKEVIQSQQIINTTIKYHYEPILGKSRALNRGLEFSIGEIILLTDDDVEPHENWIFAMCDPICMGLADAVSGNVKLATHLVRPWMSERHRSLLASTEWIKSSRSQSLVGANMAFSRKVLTIVPSFDVELGPGGLGFADDGLFASQLTSAGLRIFSAVDSNVIHHFDICRLKRSEWISAAMKHGASHAYVGHHWEHWSTYMLRFRLRKARNRLITLKKHLDHSLSENWCSIDEIDCIYDYSLRYHHLIFSDTRRYYSYHGLVKLPNCEQSVVKRHRKTVAEAEFEL